VDVKSGPNAFIVLYPERRRQLPQLEGVVELPERVAAALPRGVCSNSGAPPVEAWAALEKATAHYRLSAKTLELLRADRERIAAKHRGRAAAVAERARLQVGLPGARGLSEPGADSALSHAGRVAHEELARRGTTGHGGGAGLPESGDPPRGFTTSARGRQLALPGSPLTQGGPYRG